MTDILIRENTDIDVNTFLPGYRPAIRAFLSREDCEGSVREYPDVITFTRDMIDRIAGFLMNENDRKPATLELHRTALKQWLIKAAHAEYNAPLHAFIDQEYKRVRRVERDRSVKPSRFLKRHEVERLIESIPRRYSLIVKTLFVTGLRVSELCGILLFNCSNAGDHVDVTVIGKRSKERTIQIPVKLFAEIRDFFKGTVYLFETSNGRKYDRRNIYNEIRRHGEKVLNRKVTPHMMRHSIATYLINEKDVNLGAVSKMLGHSRQSLTADLYCHGLPAFSMIFDENGELK